MGVVFALQSNIWFSCRRPRTYCVSLASSPFFLDHCQRRSSLSPHDPARVTNASCCLTGVLLEGVPLTDEVIVIIGSGHQGDPAAEVLANHLPLCQCGEDKEHKSPVPSGPGSLSRFRHSRAHYLHYLGTDSGRVLGLVHLLNHLDDDVLDNVAVLPSCRRALSTGWARATQQAPVDGLVVDPAFCFSVQRRPCILGACLRRVLGLEHTIWRLPPFLFFGLHLLGAAADDHPTDDMLTHGYWWSRASDRALDTFGSTLVAPVQTETSDGAGYEASRDKAASPTVDSSVRASTDSGEEGPGVGAAAGGAAHNAATVTNKGTPCAGPSLNEPSCTTAKASANPSRSEPPHLSTEEDEKPVRGNAPFRLDPDLWAWRTSDVYARPLMDYWGPDHRELPPAWQRLVVGRGGLASYALFGIHAWMVAADLTVDGLSELYLAMGRDAEAGDRSGTDTAQGSHDQSDATALPFDSSVATADQFVAVLSDLWAVRPALLNYLGQPSGCDAPAPLLGEDAGAWPAGVPAAPTTVQPTAALAAAQDAALRGAHPAWADGPTADALRLVYRTPLDAGVGGHPTLLAEWHRRWRRVLAAAVERDGIDGAARAAVIGLPLTGFYPAARVALDAVRGRWEPLTAAVLSRTATVPPGGLPSTPRVAAMATALRAALWTPATAHVVGLAAAFFLSVTAEEGAAFQRHLRLDIDRPSLLPPGAAPLDAAVALAATALTGYVATRPADGGGTGGGDGCDGRGDVGHANGGGGDVRLPMGDAAAAGAGAGTEADGEFGGRRLPHGPRTSISRFSGEPIPDSNRGPEPR
eukprot:TRINITY_DN4685_c0_g2_i2.p1 TRINITY_DN4685_c0_g2~~TRINITY_DN4685_c0_g2_i2.p1  ORF type:complete len:809 (+),score=128.68 TRINITY_DN4685_c0_g2_i2:363-2789(+)